MNMDQGLEENIKELTKYVFKKGGDYTFTSQDGEHWVKVHSEMGPFGAGLWDPGFLTKFIFSDSELSFFVKRPLEYIFRELEGKAGYGGGMKFFPHGMVDDLIETINIQDADVSFMGETDTCSYLAHEIWGV